MALRLSEMEACELPYDLVRRIEDEDLNERQVVANLTNACWLFVRPYILIEQ
jgi:hypothetical protein